MPSSGDDSDGSEEEAEMGRVGAQVIDIRDRLPLRIFGDNPSGELAKKIFELILAEGGPAPHVWFAGLMVTSYAYQRLLKNIYHVDHDKLQVIFAKAMEIADSMDINVVPKTGPRGV